MRPYDESKRTHAVTPARAARWWSIGLLAAALAVAGCSGVASDAATPTPTASAAAPTATSTPTPAPTPVNEYVVQSGDTGLAIAARFNITLAQLAEANGMTEAQMDVLHIGQRLRLPPR